MSAAVRVFVSEYVCGGGWEGETIDESLAREGGAMLTAIAADFARIPGCQVVTTWDARLDRPNLPGIEVLPASDPPTERRLFIELAAACDAAFVIAPEFQNILADRRRLVDRAGGRFLGPSLPAIELCADKLLSADSLRRRGLPAIETFPYDPERPQPPGPFPFVIKPRDGAGSQHTYVVHDAATFAAVRAELSTAPSASHTPVGQVCNLSVQTQHPPLEEVSNRSAGTPNSLEALIASPSRELRTGPDRLQTCPTERGTEQDSNRRQPFVWQPFLPGAAVSVGVLISNGGATVEVFPPGFQHLSDDGRLQYLGGRIPAALPAETQAEIDRIVRTACRSLHGLNGYVGFDLIVATVSSSTGRSMPSSTPGVWIVEINPRLTTSYLGYRALTNENLAQRLLESRLTPAPIRWKSEPVVFLSDGTLV